MRAIAIAGGTGGVGRTIAEGIAATGKYKVYIFSRKDLPPRGDISFLQVDYTSPETISKSLEQAEIHTLISAIGVLTPEANQAQLNMIRAADKSAPTRRFIISSYDMLFMKEHAKEFSLARNTFEAIDELEKTDLTYTRVGNGWFLDYYGMPHYKTHLHPWINILNMEKKWAVIPGDGSTKANFITTQDMARFVARLMDVDEWPKVSTIIAETLSYNELVALAEKARGAKFDVVTDSLEKLKSGKISFIEDFPPIGLGAKEDEAFYATIHLQAGLGRFLIPDTGEEPLNKMFPDIKTTSAWEVMESSWKGK